MKNHVVNKDKILEAFILEPYKSDNDLPFDHPSHGWQVVFVMYYYPDGYPAQITINKESEEECVDLINSLGFLKI
jgi:hypothetical protein